MAKLKEEVSKEKNHWIHSHRAELASAVLILIFSVAVIIWNRGIQDQYEHYNNTNITYEKGIVGDNSGDPDSSFDLCGSICFI